MLIRFLNEFSNNHDKIPIIKEKEEIENLEKTYFFVALGGCNIRYKSLRIII